MQMLDTKSIVALALCNRQLFADANGTFAFKFATPLSIFDDELRYEHSLLRFHMNRDCDNAEFLLMHQSYQVRITCLRIEFDYDIKTSKTLIKRLADVLATNRTLTRMDVRNDSFDDEDAFHVAHALSKNTTLQGFFLSSTIMSESAVAIICAAIMSNQTLTSLHLPFIGSRTHIATHVANMLAANKTLTRLSIGSNYIGDLGLALIANALKQNATLQTLRISCNGITSAGMIQHLVPVLVINKTLTDLSVTENNIGNKGFLALANVCTINPTLCRLDLNWCNITDDAVVQFLNVCQAFKNENVKFAINSITHTRFKEEEMQRAKQCKHLV